VTARRLAALLLVPTILIFAACGGGNDSGGSGDGSGRGTGGGSGGGGRAASEATTTVWDESAIVAHLGLARDDLGISWTYTTPSGVDCNIAIVLTSDTMVGLYASAGDTVAMNPAETAGVKIVTAERATCLAAITEHLATLR
jgi:hypothetical protein